VSHWHPASLVINFTKEMQDLYTENYKTSQKETKEDLNKWKDILCSSIGRFNIVKMALLPRVIECNPYKNPNKLSLTLMEKLNLKFIWNCKGPQVAKTILKKKFQHSWRTHTFQFQNYKATVIKTVWYYLNQQKLLVLPNIAYTLSSTKLEIRANIFCLVARGHGGREGRGRGRGR
jgi:hypothetical protein